MSLNAGIICAKASLGDGIVIVSGSRPAARVGAGDGGMTSSSPASSGVYGPLWDVNSEACSPSCDDRREESRSEMCQALWRAAAPASLLLVQVLWSDRWLALPSWNFVPDGLPVGRCSAMISSYFLYRIAKCVEPCSLRPRCSRTLLGRKSSRPRSWDGPPTASTFAAIMYSRALLKSALRFAITCSRSCTPDRSWCISLSAAWRASSTTVSIGGPSRRNLW
mmetsp:Transcript_75471/g.208249  ORF Transcript_75471/g.208249 Transcript_75471/m.208249 type:complete len:222 (+) Transcript_75471:643-1308(+)